MLLDIGVTSGMKLATIRRLSQLAQKHGLNGVWVGEDIAGPHEVFTVASVILLKHSTLKVGIGITSPLIRNISTIARASVSLIEIDDNKRFRLGLGVGGLQDLKRLGIHLKHPESLMRNAATLLRRMWNGETLSHNNEHFVLESYYNRYGLSYHIPIFFGVRGPKLLSLAGEIADGVILSGPKTYLKKAINIVRSRVEKRQQSTRNFKIVVWTPTILVEKQRDLNLIRRSVAFILADTPRGVLEMSELNLKEIERIKAVSQHHGMLKASQLVTRNLIDEVAISGNPRQICEAFESLERPGVHEAVFGPPYGADAEKATVKLARAWRRFS